MPYSSLQALPMSFLYVVLSGQICLLQKLFRPELCKVARKLALPTRVVLPFKTLTLKTCYVAELFLLRPPISASQVHLPHALVRSHFAGFLPAFFFCCFGFVTPAFFAIFPFFPAFAARFLAKRSALILAFLTGSWL